MKYSNSTRPMPHLVGHHIQFKKTGKQIKEAVATKIKDEEEKLEAVRAEAAAIAEGLGVDLEASVAETEKEADGEDDDVGGALETLSVGASPGEASRSMKASMKQVEKMQGEIAKLKGLARKILGIKQNINTYQLLTQHIEDEREFQLYYSDLVSFGF